MQAESLIYTTLITTSVFLSMQDIKHKKVNLSLVLLFLGICVYYGQKSDVSPCFIPALIFIFLGSLYYLIKKASCFGMADYLIIFGVSFILPPDTWQYFLISCGFIGCILGWIYKKDKRFPFVPAILLSFFIVEYFIRL